MNAGMMCFVNSIVYYIISKFIAVIITFLLYAVIIKYGFIYNHKLSCGRHIVKCLIGICNMLWINADRRLYAKHQLYDLTPRVWHIFRSILHRNKL